jgi:superfamily II DNA or RNA helicase
MLKMSLTTSLTTRGYTVKKDELTFEQIQNVLSELTVTPFSPIDFMLSKPKPFKLYQESKTKLYLPKVYGLSKFGIPGVLKVPEGDDISCTFEGSLRQEQHVPVEKFLDACKDPLRMGGIITVPCGGGKCLGKDTPVMMFNGTCKKVQDIIVGDVLMGDDSLPRHVLSTCRGRETMYKIKQANGLNYTVNESHILSLKCPLGQVYDVSVRDYLNQPSLKLYGYKVPINFKSKLVEGDPYVIGMDYLTLPRNYIINSWVIRSRVLQGIFDKHSNYVRSKDAKYLNDVAFLSRSLGYLVQERHDGIEILKDTLNVEIEIEKLGEGNYYGFEIDGNGRFLLEDFTVTHNTTMAIYIMCQLRKKTLIVVHKDFLLQQWKERITQFAPSAKVGIVKAQKVDIDEKDAVIASLQSLSMKEYDSDFFKSFGLVIYDECHHLGAEVFSEALKKVNIKYSLGLSATPKRKDGLSKVFIWHLGEIVYSVTKRTDNVNVDFRLFSSSNPTYSTECILFKGRLNISRMINNICSFDARLVYVIDIISQILEDENDRKLLVLSDRRSHVDEMVVLLKERNYQVAPYYGGLKGHELKQAEEKQIIICTFQYACEGLDIPGLDTLVLASPKTDIVQTVGRILRTKPEDRTFTPLVIDIVDNFSIFPQQAKKRLAYYKKCKYDIIDTDGIFEDKKAVLPMNKCLIVD